MKALIVAEYYPRAGDPVGGIWAHRQTLAARDAGADVRVLVLHRPVPPLSAVRAADVGRALSVIRQPATAELDGLPVQYVRYLSPPRPWSYSSWGAWAAPAAAPGAAPACAGSSRSTWCTRTTPCPPATRSAAPRVPRRWWCRSTATTCRARGPAGRPWRPRSGTPGSCSPTAPGPRGGAPPSARATARVVHLGADVPPARAAPSDRPTLVTVGHLAARKRHADVISAVALLRDRYPRLRYVIVGDGPERERLRELATSLGVGDRVEFRGQLPNDEATAVALDASLFVMPSVDEAFGVAYIEAMAGGVPAIGCRGEDGPEEIAGAGGGIVLVPARDVRALADRIDALLADRPSLEALASSRVRRSQREFTWDRCGAQTVAAYEHVLGAG